MEEPEPFQVAEMFLLGHPKVKEVAAAALVVDRSSQAEAGMSWEGTVHGVAEGMLAAELDPASS